MTLAGRCWQPLALAVLACLVAACSSVSVTSEPPAGTAPRTERPAPGSVSTPGTVQRAASRWQPVDWSELPGFEADALNQAWDAWIRSCERALGAFVALCPQVRQLSLGDEKDKRAWMRQHLQPYRVLAADGQASPGLLTGYFEPQMSARRVPDARHQVPLFAAPAGLRARQPWYSRQEIDTLPEARAALQGRALVYLQDPIDAMLLQVQGSGRIRVTEPDGSTRDVRLAYAGHNGHAYASIGRWLIEQAGLRDASWPGIRAWLAQHPDQVQSVLWRNPRVVFFKEERLSALDAQSGPRGAQGVALTPGRSIAVDPRSIPYGTPVWLASSGPQVQLQRLVLAQDTGSAIVGAVRADYFAGWTAQAADLAGSLKQALQLWVLWPR